jgi:hypothetical protein
MTIHDFLINHANDARREAAVWTDRLIDDANLGEITFLQKELIKEALELTYRTGATDAFRALGKLV